MQGGEVEAGIEAEARALGQAVRVGAGPVAALSGPRPNAGARFRELQRKRMINASPLDIFGE